MRAALSQVRRFLFWFHVVLGVSGGLLIMLMSVTGVMLGFERQMIAAIDGTPTVDTAEGLERLPLDALLAGAGVNPADVSSVAVRRRVDQPVLVRFRDREREALALDPYRGDVLVVDGARKGQAFFSGLRRWHRWVGTTGGEWRTRMKAATGAANLGFLLLVLSGIWLWWPRHLTWSSVRPVLWFRRGLSPKARDFNLHNTIGFWSAIPLGLVVASGVFISYQWPERWLDRALGSPEEREAAIAAGNAPAATPARGGGGPAARGDGGDAAGAGNNDSPEVALGTTSTVPSPPSVDALAGPAMQRYPEWQLLTITVPEPGDSTTTVAVAEGNTYRPDLRSTLVLHVDEGRVLETRDYASLSTSRQIRAWVRFGHTGEVFGWFGQLIATIVTAGGAVLVWTGIALSWRRFVRWRARSTAAVAS